MRREQINYLNMAKGTLGIFAKHEAVWKDEALIAEGVSGVTDTCGKIDREAVLQQQNRTAGYTAEKDREREGLEDLLFRISGRIKAYALIHDNRMAASQVAFSRSNLSTMSLSTLLTTAATVTGMAVELKTALAPFKITDADVKALQEAIGNAEMLNAKRDATQGDRVENTSHLTVLFTLLRHQFKLLDTLVESYIVDEEFLGAYFATRRIHDVKGGGAKGKGKDEEPK